MIILSNTVRRTGTLEERHEHSSQAGFWSLASLPVTSTLVPYTTRHPKQPVDPQKHRVLVPLYILLLRWDRSLGVLLLVLHDPIRA